MPISSGAADLAATRALSSTRLINTATAFSATRLQPATNRVGAAFYAPEADGVSPCSPRKRLARAEAARRGERRGAALEEAIEAVAAALQEADLAAEGLAAAEAAEEAAAGGE